MGCCQSRKNNALNLQKKGNIPPISISKSNTPSIEKPPKIIHKLTIYDYNNMKVVKKLTNSYDSDVYLLTNNIVKKVYNKKNGTARKQFDNEVLTYLYLRKCNFVPNILAYDSRNLSIYTRYIYGKPKKNEKTIEMLNMRLNILSNKWGIKRITHYHWSNVIGTNDNIVLIDFGTVPFKHQLKKHNWQINFNMIDAPNMVELQNIR